MLAAVVTVLLGRFYLSQAGSLNIYEIGDNDRIVWIKRSCD